MIKCTRPPKILPRVIITYGACARVEEGEGLVSRLDISACAARGGGGGGGGGDEAGQWQRVRPAPRDNYPCSCVGARDSIASVHP